MRYIFFSQQIRETLEVLETGIEPLAEILLCCGFFMIYFVEDLVYICCGNVDYSESTEEIVMTEWVTFIHKLLVIKNSIMLMNSFRFRTITDQETPRLSISKATEVKRHLDSHRDSIGKQDQRTEWLKEKKAFFVTSI